MFAQFVRNHEKTSTHQEIVGHIKHELQRDIQKDHYNKLFASKNYIYKLSDLERCEK